MSTTCRLCSSPARLHFVQRVLARWDVAYWRCTNCDLIQSDEPVWLDEAYASAISSLDTGAIRRNMLCARLTRSVAFVAGFSPRSRCLDFGGGHGVFVRMMRDSGLDFRLCDKYASNLYARGFEGSIDQRADLLTGFEVFEHLVDVGRELDQLFAARHRVVLISTLLHRGQSPGWWYYAPDTGQHTAFYSRQTMRYIAERYGYDVSAGSAYTALVSRSQPLAAWRRRLLDRLVIRTRGDRDSAWVKACLMVAPSYPSLTSQDNVALLRQRHAA